MLAVALDLLTGRYGATEYNDRSRAEWPPHPARFFSALVATWADSDVPDLSERAALGWLEQQGAPSLVCSSEDDLARRRVVTFYVPGNDARALKSVDGKNEAREVAAGKLRRAQVTGDLKAVQRAGAAVRTADAAYRDAVRKAAMATGSESVSVIAAALEVLPESRNRQPRTFPTVTPVVPRVWFLWPDVEPTAATRATLDAVLARVARLGHSSTLVSCYVGDPPASAATLVPRPDGETVLRVPRAGLTDRLEREFVRHQGSRERVLPAPMTRYGAPEQARGIEPSGVLGGDWVVLELQRRTPDGERSSQVGITRALELARAVRDALLGRASDPSAPFVSGLFPDGLPRPHLAIVPLADVGHRWADGLVRGVALVFPTGEPRDVIEDSLREWREAGLGVSWGRGDDRLTFGAPRVAPPDETWSDAPYALRRTTWCRPARHWVSATPVALDRLVRGLHDPRRQPASDERVQEIIISSCVHTGLPEPVDVVVSPVGMTSGVPPAPAGGPGGGRVRRQFPRFVAAGSGQVRQCVHVGLTFAEKIRGPVLLGAGRYLGYGLFLPVHEDGQEQG
jgi:CRISPR-associated protein Csb2